jgi:hypothetical protein
MSDLTFGMNAGISAPRENHLHGPATQNSKTLLELFLNGAYTNLEL